MKNHYFTLCKKIIAGIGGFWHWIGLIRLHIVLVITAIVMLFQIIDVPVVHADYGINKTNNVIARMINAPVNLTASAFDGVRSFLNTVSGGVIGGRAQAIDGHAIREKNRGTPITSEEGTTTPSVNINAVTGFTQNVKFDTGFTSGAGATINGLLRGEEINLGGGKITASNVLYGLTSGDGIEVGGNTQRPTISSNLWKKENAIIMTRDPLLSLAIGSNLTVGANLAMGAHLTIGTTTTGSLISLSGTSTTVYNAFATTTVARNLINAWSIAGSATGTPIISIDSRGSGSIGIGTITPSGKLTIKNSQLGSIAFQITAADGQQADLFEINDALNKSLLVVDATGRLGIGTNAFNAALTVASTSYFSGPLTASSSVYLAVSSGRVGIGTLDPKQTLSVKGTFNVTGDARFDIAPFLTSITNCSGSSVLETDGDGRITCGQDEAGSGGSPPAKDKGEVNSGSAGAITFYASGGNTVSQATGLFYENSTGRFGIGTTSPGSILSIQGVANFATTSTSTIYSILSLPVINATSTTATSTFANGINASAGCFAIAGACVAGGSAGTVNTGTANRLAYYESTTVVSSANFLTVDATNGFLGIGTTTPGSLLSVQAGNAQITGTTTAHALIATSTLWVGAMGSLFQVTQVGNVGVGTTGPIALLSVQGDTLVSGTSTAGSLIATSTFFVGSTSGSTLYVSQGGKVGIRTTDPLDSLHIAGTLRLSTTATSLYLTPAGSNIPTKINVPSFNPGDFGQVFAMGIPAGSSDTARVFSMMDARTTDHQPSFQLISPDELSGFGLSWDGSNTSGRLESAQAIGIRAGSMVTGADHLTITTAGFIGISSSSPGSLFSIGQQGMGAGGIYMNGSIGIATSSPGAVLAIATSSAGANTAFLISNLGSGYTMWAEDSANDATPFVIDASGNVGIGTTSPGSLLSVQAGNAQVTGTTTTHALVATSTLFVGATGNLFNVMRSGNVGIGTANPLVQMHLLSSGATAVDPFGSDVLFNGTQQYVASYTSTNTDYAGFLLQARTSGARPFVQLGNSAGSLYTLMLESSNVFQIIEGNTLGTPRLVINSGNVGIGTTSPGTRLAVTGAGTGNNKTFVVADSANTTMFVIEDGGRVGIGTTSPGSLLSVQAGNAQVTGTTTTHALVATSTLFVGATGNLFNVMQSGNIGIGTTSPSARFGFTGDGVGATRAFVLADSLNRERLTFLNNGVLGIGTSSPSLLYSGTGTSTGNIASSTYLLALAGGAYFDSNLITISSSSAAHLTINYQSAATTTILNNSLFAFSIATSTTANPILRFNTKANERATTSILGGLSADNGAFEYDSSSGVTSVDSIVMGTQLFDTDAGAISWINLPISTTTAGIVQSYTAHINDVPILTIHAVTSGNGVSTTTVGIGTTTPAWLLSIASTSPFFSIMDTDAPTNQKNWTISNQTGNLYFATTSDSTYATSSDVRLMISNRGNVGIGTTSPGTRLAVTGAGTDNNKTFVVADSANTTMFVIEDGGRVGIGTTSPGSLLSVQAGNAQITGTTTAHALVATSTLFVGAQGQLFNVMQSGNVGIGTTSPGALLQIDGSINSAVTQQITNGNTGALARAYLLIGSGGASGATPNYGYLEHLSDNYATDGIRVANRTVLHGSDTGGLGLMTDDASAPIVFSTNGSTNERLRITSTGNIGIGTTTPGSLLSVQGVGNFVDAATSTLYTNLLLPYIKATSTIATSSFAGPLYIASSTPNGSAFFAIGTSSPLLWVDRDSGNVGIGTTTSGGAKFVVSSTSTQPAAELVSRMQPVYPLTVFNTARLGDNVFVSFNTDATKISRGSIDFDRTSVVVRYNTSSDIRLKNDLGSASDTTVLQNLKIHRFTWKETGSESIGVFAQEAYPVKPGAISVGTDEMDAQGNLMRPWGVDYSKYVPDLIVGWQELNSRTSFIFASTTVPRMFVDSSGNIGIGTTTPDYTLRVEGDIAAQSFVNISTRAAKEDIMTLEKGDEEKLLASLIKTQTATYHYKGEDQKNFLHLGLIAEDAPDAIKSANGKGIDLYKMATALLAGMKVQQERIEKLDAAIHASSTTPAALATNAWSVDQANGKVNVGFLGNINLENNAILDVKNITGYLGKWSIDEDGTIIAVKIITDEMITKKLAISESATFGSAGNPIGITIYDEVTKEPYCMKMHNGAMVSVAGVCGSSASGDNGVSSTPTPTPTPSPDSSSEPSPDATPMPALSSESSPSPSPSPSESATPSPEPSGV